MRKLIFVFAVLQIVVCLLPLLTPLGNLILPTDATARQVTNSLLGFLGVTMGIFTAYLGVFFAKEKAELDKIEKRLDEISPQPKSYRLNDVDFYEEFYKAARKATSHVFISYLAPYPPTDVQNSEVIAYYRSIRRLMAKNTAVVYKRIIRNTEANRTWTIELLNTLQGKPNAYIAIVDDSGISEMPLALSVQIIDNSIAWLVAIQSHQRQGVNRDLCIIDPNVATDLGHYYGRLWEKSVVLLDAGRVTADGTYYLNASAGGTTS